MPLTTDDEISDLLERTKTVALVGASPKPVRPSHRVLKFLLAHGYDVYPVNPGQAGKEIAGRLVYASLADVPVPIDMVDVFRNSKFLSDVVDQAIAIKAKSLWTQLGVIDDEATGRAKACGLHTVVDRCPAIDIPRLGLNPLVS